MIFVNRYPRGQLQIFLIRKEGRPSSHPDTCPLLLVCPEHGSSDISTSVHLCAVTRPHQGKHVAPSVTGVSGKGGANVFTKEEGPEYSV